MLIIFFGSDIIAVRKKAYDRVRKYEKEGLTIERVTPETFQPGILRDFAGAVSLFAGKQVILLDILSDETASFEELCADAEMLQESENIFIVIEGSLVAEYKKIFLKYANEHVEIQGTAKARFNSFLLTDALLERDKRTLWLLLMRAWREGITPEEIIGTLYWQVKILRLAEKTKSAEEAGQKTFVYGKAKRALSQFKEGEVTEISRTLLTIYHNGHLGKGDIDIALEKWVLSL